MGKFEVDVRIRPASSGRLRGSRALIAAKSSRVVDEAGSGKQRVGGSDKPGKESRRILTTGSILRSTIGQNRGGHTNV